MKSETFINELEDKVERRPRSTVELDLLHSIFCTYDVTATFSEDIPLALARDIKTLIRRLHLSKDGTINQGDLPSGAVVDDGVNRIDPFELKVSKLELCQLEQGNGSENCRFEQDLLHELFVMFLYTNRLRKIIPNFQLCYAGLKSRRPGLGGKELDRDRTTCIGICPCDTSQSVDYLLLERVPGIKMTQALELCTIEEFLSMILQVAFALELGAIHFGFTHYNLHPDNVIIRSIPRTKVRYFHNNKMFLLETSSVAVLTNFEMAHVKHKYEGVVSAGDETARSEFIVNQSEHFGAVGYDALGIFYNETRPFYDIYKLLMFSLRILKSKNKTVFKEARKAAKFFGFVYVVDLDKALDAEYKFGYLYSKTVSDKERSRSIRDFIALLFFEFPILHRLLTPLEDYTDVNYLNCQGYCLLGDYPLETAKIQAGRDTSNYDRYIQEATFRELMILFSSREFIERYQGLQKRADELSKKAGLLCEVKDKLCRNFTTEALEAKKELDDFRQLVEFGKLEIWRRGVEAINSERAMIDEMIRINNLDVESHLRQLRQGVVNILPSRELICYHREQIKGRLAVLVNMVSSLTQFSDQFELSGSLPEVTVDGLIPFEDEL